MVSHKNTVLKTFIFILFLFSLLVSLYSFYIGICYVDGESVNLQVLILVFSATLSATMDYIVTSKMKGLTDLGGIYFIFKGLARLFNIFIVTFLIMLPNI